MSTEGTNALILRFRGYGKTTCESIAEEMGVPAASKMTLTGYKKNVDGQTTLVRWGSRMHVGHNGKVLNKSPAIRRASNKGQARLIMAEKEVPTPQTVCGTLYNDLTTDMGVPFPGIIRPNRHFGGKNMWLYSSAGELFDILSTNQNVLSDGFYMSEIIDKVAECRVFVVEGRVTSIVQKIPDDPDAVAWNYSQGSEFKNVKWDSWHLPSVAAGIAATNALGLDFAAVDVIVDEDGNPYVLEANTAPSLLRNENGQANYHARQLAKGLTWACLDKSVEDAEHDKGWRGYIHPAIWPRRQETQQE